MTSKNTIILFSGLVCSGKSTLAIALEQKLKSMGKNVVRVNGDEYIKANFPKEGFKFDIPTRLKLDQIISNDILNREPSSTYFLVDLGSITEKGRMLYYTDKVNTILIYISTPLYVCIFRELKRSLESKSPIKNWVYLKSIKSRLLHEKDKNLIQGVTLPFEKPIRANFEFDFTKMDVSGAVNKIISGI